MKAILRLAAAAVVGLVLLPMVMVSGEGGLYLPFVLWGIAYLVYTAIFPAQKQRSAPPLAVETSSLVTAALPLSMGAASQAAILANLADVCVLGACMVWFYLTQSRRAAWTLVAIAVIRTALTAVSFTAFGWDRIAIFAFATVVFLQGFAIIFLTPFLKRRPVKGESSIDGVFD